MSVMTITTVRKGQWGCLCDDGEESLVEVRLDASALRNRLEIAVRRERGDKFTHGSSLLQQVRPLTQFNDSLTLFVIASELY